MARETTQISGQVESVNEKGIKLGGAWYNFSKFNKVLTPRRGDQITLTVENGKFITEVTFVPPTPQPAQTPTAQSAPTPAPSAPAPREHHPKSEVFSADDEPDQRTQIRIAAINASVRLYAGTGSSLDDVLNFAGQIEEWVGRA